jgi:hypothetical protein
VAKSAMQKWQHNREPGAHGQHADATWSSLIMTSLMSAVPVMITHHFPVLTCFLLYISGKNTIKNAAELVVIFNFYLYNFRLVFLAPKGSIEFLAFLVQNCKARFHVSGGDQFALMADKAFIVWLLIQDMAEALGRTE